MRLILVIELVLFCFCCKAQVSGFKFDSIECYSVPLNLKTVYNVDRNEIIKRSRFGNIVIAKNKIIDRASIDYFEMIELKDSLRSNSSQFSDPSNVDARIVLQLYSGSTIDTLHLDSKGYYFFHSEMYRPNIKLMLWLNEFCSDSVDKLFFDQGVALELKKKYNFLLN